MFMKPRCWIELALLLATPIFYGCGAWTAQVGLANAPSVPFERGAQMGGTHDAIANGPDSCQRSAKAGHDPLRFRLFPCPAEEKQSLVEPRLRWVAMLEPAVAKSTVIHRTKFVLHPSIEEVWPSRQFCYNYGAKARCLELVGSSLAPKATSSAVLGFDAGDEVPNSKMRLLPPW